MSNRARTAVRRRRLVSLGLCMVLILGADASAKTKTPRPPRPEPELKILALTVSPSPYQPGAGPLNFTVTAQLPKELNGATILEVSSLISSPSKTSLRFLSHRQPVDIQAAAPMTAEHPTMSLQLSWDGQDHRKQIAVPGIYSYEVRLKLLANGEKGPRTLMVAWPKRGMVEVR